MTRPRRECPRCHKLVAVDANGRLWWHQRVGWGMWEEEGRCLGSGTRETVEEALR